MNKITIVIETKRPTDATPQRALELSKKMTQANIARLWGISRQRVHQLIKTAKKQAKSR